MLFGIKARAEAAGLQRSIEPGPTSRQRIRRDSSPDLRYVVRRPSGLGRSPLLSRRDPEMDWDGGGSAVSRVAVYLGVSAFAGYVAVYFLGRRAGSTAAERAARLPGDELVPLGS